MYFKSIYFIILSTQAHMEMVKPRIPYSRYDDSINEHEKNYENIFPIGNLFEQTIPFCHQDMSETEVLDTIEVGTEYITEFNGLAQHDGGHCEFSLSYDGKNFAVIHTIISECIRNELSHKIKIPHNAPSGIAVLSWTWVNRIGQREFYMNCAKINLIGGSTFGTISGPERLIVNLPGYPVIHQFKFSVKGVYLYRNRNTMSTGLDSNGIPTFELIDNTSADLLPGKNYFYDPLQPDLDPTNGFLGKGLNEDQDD